MAFFTYPLSQADLDVVDEIVKAAYNVPRSRRDTLYQYLQLQPDGAFVVKEDSIVVGFGAALDYGMFAYIGLMSVHPSAKTGSGTIVDGYTASMVSGT